MRFQELITQCIPFYFVLTPFMLTTRVGLPHLETDGANGLVYHCSHNTDEFGQRQPACKRFRDESLAAYHRHF